MPNGSLSSLIRVLVSDHTRFHTELLADALKRDGGFQVTTSTSGSVGLAEHLNLKSVDVLLMSSALDDQPGRGFEVLRRLHSSHGDLPAVMLLESSKREVILEAFGSGARGVFARHEPMDTLTKCVRRVHEGQIWANSEQMGILVGALASSQNIRAVNALDMNLLSKREMEIVRQVARGLTNREIAKQLGLSPHTIKNCLFRIFDKLGVSNRVELLLMTMSGDRDEQSALLYMFDNHGDVSLRDESALAACQYAAEQGALIAQLALAQFYSANITKPCGLLHTYAWYSIAMQQISREWQDVMKTMSADQVLEAERMAEGLLGKMDEGSGKRDCTSVRKAKSRTLASDIV